MIGTLDHFLARFYLYAFNFPKTMLFFLICFGGIFVYTLYKIKNFSLEKKTLVSKINVLFNALETQHDGYYLWIYDEFGFLKQTHCSRRLSVLLDLKDGMESKFESVLAKFDTENANYLSKSVADMRLDHSPFDMHLIYNNKKFVISGHQVQYSKQIPLIDIVWFSDITDNELEIDRLNGVVSELKYKNSIDECLFNSFPFPVWTRNNELQISNCNEAYLKATHAENLDEVVNSNIELVYDQDPRKAKVFASQVRTTGKTRMVTEYAVMNGKRRRVELFEIPLPDRQTFGFVNDITLLQEAKDEIQRNNEAHDAVLEHLKTAIAIFDENMRLKYYNVSFVNLWDLEVSWLDNSPTYTQFLEILREKRKLPEKRIFDKYRKQELENFTNLTSQKTEEMTLQNGIVLYRTITPHPMGGLFFTYDDVTKTLSKEKDVLLMNENYQKILNQIDIAIAVFGQDTKLKQTNKAYQDLWEFESEEPMGILDVISEQEKFFGENWKSIYREIKTVVSSKSGDIFQITRTDGKVLEFSAHKLPDRGTLLMYREILAVKAHVQGNVD